MSDKDKSSNSKDLEMKEIITPPNSDNSGYFIVSKKENKNYEIEFIILKKEIPADFQNLYVKIEKTLNIIKTLKNTSEEIKENYFEELLSIAQVGLVGEKANPNIAKKALELLKDEIIIVEGQRIKNEYIKDLGIKASILIGILTILYIGIHNNSSIRTIENYIMVFIGSIIGTWVSFGARKVNITFEQLSIPEEDMMDTWIRLIYIGISSMIFMLFLNTGIVKIEIGGINSTKIAVSYELQLLIGIICGLIESKIGLRIYNQANKIISEDIDSNESEKNN